MAARHYQASEFFRHYHLPVISAEQNDSQSERINAIGESQVEKRPVSMEEAEIIRQITSATKTKSQLKRKASATSGSISTEKKPRKFSWTPKSVEILLKYTKKIKTKCEYGSVDFEADLQSLYTELCQCMETDSQEDLGPEVVSLPRAQVKDMDAAE